MPVCSLSAPAHESILLMRSTCTHDTARPPRSAKLPPTSQGWLAREPLRQLCGQAPAKLLPLRATPPTPPPRLPGLWPGCEVGGLLARRLMLPPPPHHHTKKTCTARQPRRQGGRPGASLTWKGCTRMRRWKASLPAYFTMYLLPAMRAASSASLQMFSFSQLRGWGGGGGLPP